MPFIITIEVCLFITQDIPPLQQTIEEVIQEYNDGTVFKVDDGNRIIGSVRVKCEGIWKRITELL